MIRIAIVEDDHACADILLEYLARYEKESGTSIQCTRFGKIRDVPFVPPIAHCHEEHPLS